MRRRSGVLRDFSARHLDALKLLDRLVAEGVPRAYSLCEAFSSPLEVAGVTLGNVFREFLIQACEAVPADAWGDLSFSVGTNRSVVFTDPLGREVRVRKLPVDWRSRREIDLPRWEPLTLFPSEALSGASDAAIEQGSQDLVVLWRPDPGSAKLDRAVLASVIEAEQLGVSRVLDFVPLSGAPAAERVASAEDFDSFFGAVAGLIGPETR